ncbi:hypothetical protein KY290_011841 [Solanum tuberosum]|uniref:Uncharacterized protein n=1 Tax=Solanum tuberosum TaxID=4113 RepID=A0ABQ7W3Y4_SOLTU|nr:hypothetical protein KY284_011933 [Solanum tuberosum]KAH0736165.1 hypothetical protein KY285_011872 [Solanum tuberosum]KAH0774704.1 hypothetical protein KY290_011841 [Solanum tuberosum]
MYEIWVPNQVYSYFTESFRLLPPVDACHQPPIVRLPRRQCQVGISKSTKDRGASSLLYYTLIESIK